MLTPVSTGHCATGTRRRYLTGRPSLSAGRNCQALAVRHVLELHAPTGRPYYIGVFLVGAYQETLGELHNLFGDTDAVHVHVYEDGTYAVEQVVEGDSVEDVLAYVQYDRRMLTERVRRSVEEALRKGGITLEESALLRRRYGQGLSGYTYMDREE